MSQHIKIPVKNGQDIELELKGVQIDGQDLVFTSAGLSYVVTLWTQFNGKKCIYSHIAAALSGVADVPTSDIQVNATAADKKLTLYIQSSVVPFGTGILMCRIDVYATDTNFPKGYKVIRSADIESNLVVVE